LGGALAAPIVTTVVGAFGDHDAVGAPRDARRVMVHR